MTSQGVPFIFAGDEMMRDKKGVHNSYNSPDDINTIDWKNKTAYKDVFEYVKELIALRKAHPAFRMGDAGMVRAQMEFLPVEGSNVVAFILKGNANGDTWKNIIVALNSRTTGQAGHPIGKVHGGVPGRQGQPVGHGPGFGQRAGGAGAFGHDCPSVAPAFCRPASIIEKTPGAESSGSFFISV